MNQKEYLDFIKQWKEENRELINSGKCRKVFTENLHKKEYKGRKCIDWKNSIGYKVHFIYDDIEGDLEIIDYIKSNKKSKIEIKYKNKLCIINSNHLKECKIGTLLNKKTSNFKIEIGQVIKDDKRDITIIDREYRKNNKNCNLKYYKYYCNKCGNEDWMTESCIIKQNIGCNRCCKFGHKVDESNCIATTHPYLMKYLVDKEDGYKYSYGSDIRVLCKCPNCGNIKKIKISNLFYKGFKCEMCKDNISKPEKIVCLLFKNLKIDNYVYQYTKTNAKWCGLKRYDFYFEKDGKKYIVETHGLQHYEENKGWKTSLKEIQQNDLDKYNLAIKNGIKPENYIIIDCRESNLEFIKNNIIHSRLNEIFDLSEIDWDKIKQNSEKSILNEICEYWNKFEKEIQTKEVCKKI